MTDPNAYDSPTMITPWAQSGRQPSIAIIGAGMSGIAAVVKLQKAGYTNVTVYEKPKKLAGPGEKILTQGCPAMCHHVGTASTLASDGSTIPG